MSPYCDRTTYIQVSGQWKYLYRAVDSEGQTIDFLMSARRDAAACRFLENAIELHGIPQKICIDVSPANKAAILERRCCTNAASGLW